MKQVQVQQVQARTRIWTVALCVALGSMATRSSAQQNAVPAPVPPQGMVYVPAGDFAMGTDESDEQGDNHPRQWDDARPRHTAKTRAFFLDKTEVTNAQYKAYCDSTGYPVPTSWVDGTFPKGQENFPVARVNWWEASAYARWAGKRLPTETEWEKAARGTDGRVYPWGNDWDANRAIAETDSPGNVGSKPEGASPYGAMDMTGNVFEWTADWYSAYPQAPRQFPQYGEQFKVVRGGAWWGFEAVERTYYRSVMRPGTRSEMIGFRCAKDAPR